MTFRTDDQRRAFFARVGNRFSKANADILSGKRWNDVAMLAKFEKKDTSIDKLLNDPNWVACEKYDGIRAMAVGVNGSISLFNPRKGGDDIAWKFPEVVGGISELFGGDEPFIIDGEIVSNVHDKNDFHDAVARVNVTDRAKVKSMSGSNPVVFKVFDVLELNDVDMKGMPLRERKKILDSVVGDGNSSVIPEVCAYNDKMDFANSYISSGGEGVVFKDLNSTYEMGARSGSWIKYKIADDDTFMVYGFEKGTGKNRERVGSLLIGKFENDKFVSKGKVGSGLKDSERKYLWDKYNGGDKDYLTLPEDQYFGVDVKYMEEDINGGLRQPRVERLREDLNMEAIAG